MRGMMMNVISGISLLLDELSSSIYSQKSDSAFASFLHTASITVTSQQPVELFSNDHRLNLWLNVF